MVKTISREELKRKIDNDEKFVLLDIRSEKAYRKRHIKGAMSLHVRKLWRAEQEFEKDEEIIVYCASFSCMKSLRAAKMLEEMRFKNVTDYEGGLRDWISAGYPIEKCEDLVSTGYLMDLYD